MRSCGRVGGSGPALPRVWHSKGRPYVWGAREGEGVLEYGMLSLC